MKEYLDVVPDDLLDMLEKGEESEVLSIITMSVWFYIKKYNRALSTTLTLVRKGYYKLNEFIKEGE